MSFEIKIEGLNELERYLRRLTEEFTLSSIDYWCKKIEGEAKAVCPHEYQGTIVLRAVPAGLNAFDIQFKAFEEAVPYVKQAIKKNLNSMPLFIRVLFENLLKEIEKC